MIVREKLSAQPTQLDFTNLAKRVDAFEKLVRIKLLLQNPHTLERTELAEEGGNFNLLRANQGVMQVQNGWAFTPLPLTLVNGLNSNIAIAGSQSVGTAVAFRITGPTLGFSVGGFTGGVDGRLVMLYNSTTQQMTIVNNDAGSSVGNKILTLTGANVVLRAGTSFATLMYFATDSSWILVSAN